MRRRRLTRDQKFIVSAVAAGLLLAAGHGQGGPGHAAAAATAGPGSSNEQLANSMAASGYGWTGSQATCLDQLWTEESGFSATAANSDSDAPASRSCIPAAHAVPASRRNAARADQLGPGLHRRHGTATPCAAWAFETSHVPNWY